MEKLEQIKQYASNLRLNSLRLNPQELIHKAQVDKPTYMDFTLSILKEELGIKQEKEQQSRIKKAGLPKDHDLDNFDFNFSTGITKTELMQLRELAWLEQNYNLVLMGPSGVGKTFIAAGMVYQAVKAGYKAYFKSMEEIINILNMREMTAAAMNAYKRLLKADLLAIDDIMLFPIKKRQAVEFFNLINQLHEKCSIIITTNKAPKQWAEALEDEVLATALLDRLLYHCEVIKLDGNSYRMENRKTIFNND